MTIETVVQRGSTITIYGENRQILGAISTSNAGDTLLGYTGSSVTVRKGDFVNVYNEHGACISSYSA